MWTRQILVVTLSVPFFGNGAFADGSDAAIAELQAQLDEAVVARNVAEQRCAELRASLAQARKDLEALRGRYAELLVKSRSRELELEELRIGVTGLLFEPGEDSGAVVAAQAVRALRDLQKANAALYTGVQQFAEYLRGVIDALQPSAAVRREIGLRLDALEGLAAEAERSPSTVAWRGGNQGRSRRECRVLAVSDEFQLVILDIGAADGARLGMLWEIHGEEAKAGQILRLVDVRPSLSAAVPTSGEMAGIAPGMLAKAGTVGDGN